MEANQTLGSRQIRAIHHLLRAPTIEAGCRRARVSKAALNHWLDDQAFREELKRQREQLTAVALAALAASVVKASAVLVGLLDSPKDHVRLKAAETIVRLERKLSASDDMDERDKPAQRRGIKADNGLRHLLSPAQLAEMRKVDRMAQKTKQRTYVKSIRSLQGPTSDAGIP